MNTFHDACFAVFTDFVVTFKLCNVVQVHDHDTGKLASRPKVEYLTTATPEAVKQMVDLNNGILNIVADEGLSVSVRIRMVLCVCCRTVCMQLGKHGCAYMFFLCDSYRIGYGFVSVQSNVITCVFRPCPRISLRDVVTCFH